VSSDGRDSVPRADAPLTERDVLALGLAFSAAFVAAASVAATFAGMTGGSIWAAIHLALAGAATVAIGAFMPHFAVTLAGTRPAPSGQRLAVLSLLVAGSVMAVLGVTLLGGAWAAGGAVLVVGGLGGVAWHTVAPLREPLARRHPIVVALYGTALVELATGVMLGGTAAAGMAGVLAGWALLRPAHVWLTLFGGISLTIFATLVYLAPTVYGTRIRAGRWLAAGVLGMGIGPIVTAAAFALDSRPGVLAGVGLTLVGAFGQIGYLLDARRRRGPYTSEHDWRAVATGHMTSGPLWFAAAVTVAFGDLAAGRPLAGWSIGVLALPMIAGWMLQELVGSWTHLVPSVTPGDAAAHARQRRHLAVASRLRLVIWNVAVGLAWAGLATDVPPMAVAGFGLLAASVAVALVALVGALRES
jgi:hypothetical protein